MALSLNTSSCNPSLHPLLLQTQKNQSPKSYTLTIRACSNRPVRANATGLKRRPRPSFFEQIKDKWSRKPTSTTHNLPWQQQQNQRKQSQEDEPEEVIDNRQSSREVASVSGIEESSSSSSSQGEPVSSAPQNQYIRAPWNHGAKPRKGKFDSGTGKVDNFVDGFSETGGDNVVDSVAVPQPRAKKEATSRLEEKVLSFDDDLNETSTLVSGPVAQNGSIKGTPLKKNGASLRSTHLDFREAKVNNFVDGFVGDGGDKVVDAVRDKKNGVAKEVDCNSKLEDKVVNLEYVRAREEEESVELDVDVSPTGNSFRSSAGLGSGKVSDYDNGSSVELPWKTEKRRSNTWLAEKLLPEHELKRLRNVSLRMLERIKVGLAGINQDLVDEIHQRWRVNEVVKLKFIGPLACQMRRTHEMLESRTGGLVIWRSGSSVVLYRGIAYKFQCVQTYTNKNEADTVVLPHNNEVMNNSERDEEVKRETFMPDVAKQYKNLSKEELVKLVELNHLLDELGPRYNDWCGREPLPVDADLLPAVVPGYKPPLRLRAYGVRRSLGDKQMTYMRRLARITPPHFALGRNKELQGLANAMVKLWAKSVIAKIAIKRGVQTTSNERMAETLKRLTGGTLLSRNKEYIVFYRGNDFLPPPVHDTLKERRELTYQQQDVEEQARKVAFSSVKSNIEATNVRSIAGTLAETMAATSQWGNLPSREDVEEMRKDSALARRALLVQHLENKLARAKGKRKKAEKALAKVQEFLEPTDLPTDLETLTDEERVLYRKMGLSMKPYLLLGRRGVYGGTLENIHLHWKYRELVKVIVKGKNFAQVKHIAIDLEAESGGVLVSVDKTTKGYAVIIYRGKNYLRPIKMKPSNLLTRRQALARSIELQRREALKHHITDLQERIELVKAELEEMRAGKTTDMEKSMQSMLDDSLVSDNDEEDEGEEAYLEVYDSSKNDTDDDNLSSPPTYDGSLSDGALEMSEDIKDSNS